MNNLEIFLSFDHRFVPRVAFSYPHVEMTEAAARAQGWIDPALAKVMKNGLLGLALHADQIERFRGVRANRVKFTLTPEQSAKYEFTMEMPVARHRLITPTPTPGDGEGVVPTWLEMIGPIIDGAIALAPPYFTRVRGSTKGPRYPGQGDG